MDPSTETPQSNLSATPRPRSVTIVASMQILQGLTLVGLGLYEIGFSHLANPAYPLRLELFSDPETLLGAGLVLLGLLLLLVAWALLRLNPWGWVLSISVQGIGLLAALIRYGLGQPNYWLMAMGVVMVFYLNHQEIQAAFRSERELP